MVVLGKGLELAGYALIPNTHGKFRVPKVTLSSQVLLEDLVELLGTDELTAMVYYRERI